MAEPASMPAEIDLQTAHKESTTEVARMEMEKLQPWMMNTQ
jgi:hypothetical protein